MMSTRFRLTRVFLLVALPSFSMLQAVADEVRPVAWVDPMIATGGNSVVCGHNSPGATTPLGLVRLSPDTISASGRTANNTSGYFHNDPYLIGFSHTRLCGTGAVDGGQFRVIPTGGDAKLEKLRRNMRAKLDHDRESASPGYYSIELPEHFVRAELTATPRVGFHRYHFSAASTPRIIIDIGSALGRGTSDQCAVVLSSQDQEVTGSARSFGSFSGRYGGLTAYFAAKLRTPWDSAKVWSGDQVDADSDSTKGDDVGVELTFASSDREQTIELVLAISYVSIDGARRNLEAELAERSFDDVRQAATDRWNRYLNRIEVEGGTESDRRIFYTALYRSFVMPTAFNDTDGNYLGFDGKVHQADDFTYYTDMSLWDTFRTTHPLFTLIAADRHRDMLVSLVKMAEQGGNLPRWPSGAGYTGSMFGAPADAVIAEAYLKGIHDFDVQTAYRTMLRSALHAAPAGARYSSRRGIADFNRYGYCPSDTMDKAVAKTLEYATTDAAIGRLAEALGKNEDAELFRRRGQNYRSLWNPETKYFQPRDSAGEFSTPLQPLLLTYLDFRGTITDDYCEGSALQWRWSVAHDAAGLVSLFDDPQEFVSELEAFLAGSKSAVGKLPNGYYWQGNQPDIHAAYLFNAAGRPDLTQKWVRWILKHKHDDTPVGLDGNDDGGTLSAWYVLSSLGFYPIVGSDRYELGSPLWKEATIQVGDQRLSVVAKNYAPDRVYVQQVELNGKELDRTWFTHDEIASGGTLQFTMSDRPAR